MIQKIHFIVNPSSGNQLSSRKIQRTIELLLDEGYTITKFNTKKKDDAYHRAKSLRRKVCDLVVVCGGDGTVNEVVNGLMNAEEGIPMAIISTGTVNDFATYLQLPTDPQEFCRMVKDEKFHQADVGLAGDRYFMNVCAIGNIANVAHETDIHAKTIFGKLAYVVEGIKEMPSTINEPMHLKFITEQKELEADTVLVLVSNTTSVGGFTNICPEARIDDGLLDVLIIKSPALITDLGKIFIEIFMTKHSESKDVIYFQTGCISIHSESKNSVDVDGECAGVLPTEIRVASRKINIMIKE